MKAEKRRLCAKVVSGERTRGVVMSGNEEKRGVMVRSYSADLQEESCALAKTKRKRVAKRNERGDMME